MKPSLFIISSFLIATHVTGSESQESIDPIKTGLLKLQQTGESEALKPAITSFKEKLSKLSPQKKLEAYLDFINQIMVVYDPNFDVKPPAVFLNLSPGPGYDSGISPEAITDKKTREAYERALAENAKNNKITSIQRAARNALDGLGSGYAAALKSPELSDQDRANAIEKIKTSNLPDLLKARIIPQDSTKKTILTTGGKSKSE